MQFSFSYPAAWTENECQRVVVSDGTQTLHIGNLFWVARVPRAGMTIQQWVSSQTNQYEVVTLRPLTDSHAQSAVTISAQPAATPDPNKPFDAEPLSDTLAIVAGSQYFYEVGSLIAVVNETDTTPPLWSQQLAQQIVGTFVVS